MTDQKETPPEGGAEPVAVTIGRDVFIDVAGTAFAAYLLAQANFLFLVRRGLMSPEDAIVTLKDMEEIARRAGKLGETAIPRLRGARDQILKGALAAQAPQKSS